MAEAPNLVNLEKVSKSYGVRPLLTEVSLGVGAGERIGIVGRSSASSPAWPSRTPGGSRASAVC